MRGVERKRIEIGDNAATGPAGTRYGTFLGKPLKGVRGSLRLRAVRLRDSFFASAIVWLAWLETVIVCDENGVSVQRSRVISCIGMPERLSCLVNRLIERFPRFNLLSVVFPSFSPSSRLGNSVNY